MIDTVELNKKNEIDNKTNNNLKINNDILKVKVLINNIIFPRNVEKIVEGTWGVCSCSIIENNNPNSFITTISVNGELPNIDLTKRNWWNITYKLIANKVIDKKYGLQYKIIYLQPEMNLENKDQLQIFLKYILTDLQIKNLYDVFNNPLEIIRNGNIDELCKVKGIGKSVAKHIINKYKDNEIYEEAILELGQYDLPINMIKKIINHYGSINKSLDIVKNNPYRLASDIDGIGWTKADSIGMKIGFPRECVERIAGFVQYFLKEKAINGNSWLNKKELVLNVLAMYDKYINEKNKPIILDNLKKALERLKSLNIIMYSNEYNYVCLTKYYLLEKDIKNELIRLINGEKITPNYDLQYIVNSINQEKGYELTNEQIDGINLLINNNVGIITGGAGVGKSTTVEGIIKLFNNYKFAQTALSGKAAARLTEITKLNGYTIHRLLGYDSNTNKFKYNQENKLPYDIIIVDEISMVGGELFYDLISAIPTNSKLIMLGDHHQLESIGSLNLLKDMLDSDIIPKKILTKIHRQAQKSAIITESNKVKDGIQIIPKKNGLKEIINTYGELQDLTVNIVHRNRPNHINKIIDNVKEYFIKEYTKLNDITKIQVIVPMVEKSQISTTNINNLIQNIYNPKLDNCDINNIWEIRNKKDAKNDNDIKYEFRINDRVINTINMYKKEDIDGNEVDVFNGYLGIVTNINYALRKMIINFDGIGEVVIDNEDIMNIKLAYAITCHKFQGSQAHTIIIAFDYSSFILLSKQWLYTAITRAQKYCILCAEFDALKYAIDTNKITLKQTFLKDMLNGILV
jgi:exodeoxyribonuclease V alpha subunit